jgi:DNA-binding transcriptional regulator YiaG
MMTPADLRAARHALGLSAEGFARVLGVSAARTVQRWEAGDRDIPGTVAVLIKILMESAQARKIVGLEPHPKP